MPSFGGVGQTLPWPWCVGGRTGSDACDSSGRQQRATTARGVRPARRPISSLGLLLLSLNAAQGHAGRAADVSILILPRFAESGNRILGVRTELPQRSGRCCSDAGILVL